MEMRTDNRKDGDMNRGDRRRQRRTAETLTAEGGIAYEIDSLLPAAENLARSGATENNA
jgi:hypothetical protein